MTTLTHLRHVAASQEALKSDLLGVIFETCLGSGLEDDILRDFDDFGLHLGVPGETILEQLVEKDGFLQFCFYMVPKQASSR